MTQVFELVSGVLMEPLGNHWAVFSPASGETHIVNDTSAAVLELLSESPTLTLDQACVTLSGDVGLPLAEVQPMVGDALRTFVTAGLVRTLPAGPSPGSITT